MFERGKSLSVLNTGISLVAGAAAGMLLTLNPVGALIGALLVLAAGASASFTSQAKRGAGFLQSLRYPASRSGRNDWLYLLVLVLAFAAGNVSGIIGGVVLAVIALIFLQAITNIGWQRIFTQLERIILGEGRASRIMLLIWLTVPVLLYQATSSVFGADFRGLFGIAAIMAGLVVLHELLRRENTSVLYAVPAALAVCGVVYVALFPLPDILSGWTRIFGLTMPAMTAGTIQGAFVLLVTLITLALVISRRVRFNTAWRVLGAGLVSGILLSIALAYPVQTLVYTGYVPYTTFTGTAHDIAAMVALVISAIVTLLIGPAAVVVARPVSSGQQRAQYGALAGLVAGMTVFGLVGGAAAGVIASVDLYGVALSRVGYNEAEWLLKLAHTVNNNTPIVYLFFVVIVIIGLVISALTAAFTPVRGSSPAQSETSLLWLQTSLLAIPALTVTLLVVTVMLALLGPSMDNIFATYGTNSDWSPLWNLFLVAAPFWLTMTLLQFAIIRYLYQAYIHPQQACDPVLRHAIITSSVMTILFAVMLMATNTGALTTAAGVWTIGWSIEILRLALMIQPEKTRTLPRQGWMAAGAWSGIVTALLGFPFTSIVLNLVLLPVVFIVQLADSTKPVAGLLWMQKNINDAVIVHAQSSSMVVVTLMLVMMVVALLVALDFPAVVIEPALRKIQRMYAAVSARLSSMNVPPLVHGMLIPVTAMFMPSRLRKMPALVAIGPLVITGLGLHLILTGTPLPAPQIMPLILVIQAIGLYHYIGLYGSEASRTALRTGMTVVVAVFVGLILVVQQPIVHTNGGVSQFDGSRWTVYNTENSTLGTQTSYDLFQSDNGTLYFTSPGGAISTFDGSNWSLSLLVSESAALRQDNPGLTGTTRVKLAEDTQHNLWIAAGKSAGRLIPSRRNGQILSGGLSIASLCPESELKLGPGQTGTCLNQTINDIQVAPDGSVWLATDQNVFQVEQDGTLVAAQNYPVEFDGNYRRIVGGTQWHEYGNHNDDWMLQARNIGFPLTGVKQLSLDNGYVYSRGDDGVLRWNDEHTAILYYIEDEPVTQMLMNTGGRLLMAGYDSRQDISSLMFADNNAPYAGFPGYATALAGDASGTLWIGTPYGLLSMDAAGASEAFNSSNSGLAANTVYDVLVAQNGDLWVSTYERTESRLPGWLPFLLALGMTGIIGGGIVYDYNSSPEARARRKGRHLATVDPASLYSQVYPLMADMPDPDMLHTVGAELSKAGDPFGGSSLFAFADLMRGDDIPVSLDNLARALDADTRRGWTGTLSRLYRLAQAACSTTNVNAIVNLELITNPGQTGGTISLTSRDDNINPLPPFLPEGTAAVWQALSLVSTNLRKYNQVDDTADRLSYLAAALSAVETAGSSANAVAAPDGIVLQFIAGHWRSLIADAINLLSGSAELRLELRTRQVQRSDQVVLVLRLENTGRAAAENIRITFKSGENYTATGEAEQSMERLPAGRNLPLEFALIPGEASTARVVFTVTWDDRLDSGKTFDYADEVRFYDAAGQFQPVANPYIVGHPVKSRQMFFGREDVFRFIMDNISGGDQNRTLVIYGQRRTGKTSLLYQLANGRPGDRFIPVFIDMQALALSVESTGDFLGEMAYQMGRTITQTGAAIDVPEIDGDTKQPTRVFNRFLDTLPGILGDRRILIIIDEFELIEDKIRQGKLEAGILDYFRSLIQHRNELVFIFTGTHRLEEMSQDYWSILFNIALYRQMTYLSEAEATALIRQPVRDALTVDDLAVEKIIRLTNGHPYFIQLLCWALVNHCNERQRNYASINDINDALNTMLTTGEAHFAYIWQRADHAQQIVMAALAQTADHTTLWVQPAGLMETLRAGGQETLSAARLLELLDHLTAEDVLEQASEGSLRYRFRLEVLRLWVKQNKSLAALIERGRTS